MKLIDARAKDVYGLFEISLCDLKKLKLALSGLELSRSDNKEKNDAIEYVANVFYAHVSENIDKLEAVLKV